MPGPLWAFLFVPYINNLTIRHTDPEVLQRAQTFLQEAAGNDATKAALVELVKHVARHPEAQDAVVGLARYGH